MSETQKTKLIWCPVEQRYHEPFGTSPVKDAYWKTESKTARMKRFAKLPPLPIPLGCDETIDPPKDKITAPEWIDDVTEKMREEDLLVRDMMLSSSIHFTEEQMKEIREDAPFIEMTDDGVRLSKGMKELLTDKIKSYTEPTTKAARMLRFDKPASEVISLGDGIDLPKHEIDEPERLDV